MGLGSSSPEDLDQSEEMMQMVKKLIDSDEIVIFSKTTCPYCKSAKGVSFIFECALRVEVNYLYILLLDVVWMHLSALLNG